MSVALIAVALIIIVIPGFYIIARFKPEIKKHEKKIKILAIILMAIIFLCAILLQVISEFMEAAEQSLFPY